MVHNHSICTKVRIPTRFVLALMIFSACLFSYMLRVNMSINLIAMVQPTTNALSGKVNVPECLASNNESKHTFMNTITPDYGVRYNWDQKTQGLILGAYFWDYIAPKVRSQKTQGLILGAYFWGYIVTQIPGGLLAEKWGTRNVVGATGLLSALFTMLIPVAASIHFGLVIAIRFILGFMNGVIYPALHCLISKWVPPTEKGKFTGALLGGNFGTVITWPILASISEQWGWVWSFYVPGVLCLLWVCCWFYFVYNTPEEHPRILEEEKKYIENCLGNTVSKSKNLPPYKEIFKSIPFWAVIILHFGNCWGLAFLLTMGPKYLAEVLGFNLTKSGGLAALPHLARMTMAFVFGSLGDYIRAKQWLSVTGIRKWFVIFSHFLPGILLFVQPSVGCEVVLAIIIITLSLGLNGACTITNVQNNQDLAPNYAGSLYGIINCVGSSTGFITPILAGYITQDNNGLAEWRTIFTIGAAVYVISGIIFCIFGSGEIQPWNEIKSDETVTDDGIDNKGFSKTENSNDSKKDSVNQTTEVTKV